jgi:hypothetical protein
MPSSPKIAMKKLLLAILLLASGLPAFAYSDIEDGVRVFLTRDPAGFVDGPNLYAYVKQNPWTNFDPEGLATQQDYTNDEAKAQTWHAQASKEAGGDKAAQKKVDDTYNSWVAADKKGVNSIEQTAKYVKTLADQYHANIGSESDIAGKLDDSWQSYKDVQPYRAMGVTPNGIETGKQAAEVTLAASATVATAGLFADSAVALRGAVWLETKYPTIAALSGIGAGGYYTAEQQALVSRWGRPGLQAGDWVMKGGATKSNYFWSGKYQPGWVPTFGQPPNIPAPFSAGQQFSVPSSTLSFPPGFFGPVKGALGQRIYNGETPQ